VNSFFSTFQNHSLSLSLSHSAAAALLNNTLEKTNEKINEKSKEDYALFFTHTKHARPSLPFA
jgi:hypothetical protein